MKNGLFPHLRGDCSPSLAIMQVKHQRLNSNILTLSALWQYHLLVTEKSVIGIGTPYLRKRTSTYVHYFCTQILLWRCVWESPKARRFFRSGSSISCTYRRPHAWNHDRRSIFIRKGTVMSDRLSSNIIPHELLASSQYDVGFMEGRSSILQGSSEQYYLCHHIYRSGYWQHVSLPPCVKSGGLGNKLEVSVYTQVVFFSTIYFSTENKQYFEISLIYHLATIGRTYYYAAGCHLPTHNVVAFLNEACVPCNQTGN